MADVPYFNDPRFIRAFSGGVTPANLAAIGQVGGGMGDAAQPMGGFLAPASGQVAGLDSSMAGGLTPGGGFSPAGDGGIFGIQGLGKNLQTLQLGLGGLNTLGSLWGAASALKLANKQFDYTKSVTDTNLANQIKSYNTGLEDRAANRAAFGGQPQSSADAYVAAHQLTRS